MAVPKFVNAFMVGADPECVLLDPPRLVNSQQLRQVERADLFGWDHAGWVVEPHPTPNISVRKVCQNLRASLDYLNYQYPEYKFRGGAYYEGPGQRGAASLGGHVHLDMRMLEEDKIIAMDKFTQSLVDLDILPKMECAKRTEAGAYGQYSDVRMEHGHVEYRSMCSWLFNPKVAMLCMTGIKLAAVDPSRVKRFGSVGTLANWFEGFKEADDDARWIMERDYFTNDLTAQPDASVMPAWKASKERGKALGDLFVSKQVAAKLARAVRVGRNELGAF